MLYKLAADFTVLIHFGFITFVVLGGLFVLIWPRIAWVHIPAVAWGVWIELTHGICPLTPLEQTLRNKADVSNYQGNFIDHYIIPLIYPSEFSSDTAQQLGLALLTFTLLVYAAVILRWTRKRAGKSPDS